MLPAEHVVGIGFGHSLTLTPAVLRGRGGSGPCSPGCRLRTTTDRVLFSADLLSRDPGEVCLGLS